jgi:hypothetical protein
MRAWKVPLGWQSKPAIRICSLLNVARIGHAWAFLATREHNFNHHKALRYRARVAAFVSVAGDFLSKPVCYRHHTCRCFIPCAKHYGQLMRTRFATYVAAKIAERKVALRPLEDELESQQQKRRRCSIGGVTVLLLRVLLRA